MSGQIAAPALQAEMQEYSVDSDLLEAGAQVEEPQEESKCSIV